MPAISSCMARPVSGVRTVGCDGVGRSPDGEVGERRPLGHELLGAVEHGVEFGAHARRSGERLGVAADDLPRRLGVRSDEQVGLARGSGG